MVRHKRRLAGTCGDIAVRIAENGDTHNNLRGLRPVIRKVSVIWLEPELSPFLILGFQVLDHLGVGPSGSAQGCAVGLGSGRNLETAE